MTPKEFRKYLDRDKHCFHCGMESDDLIPHHRLNRGAGGKNSKANQPSNIIVVCAYLNFLMEADPLWAARARAKGWKLQSWQNPEEEFVYDFSSDTWYQLDNEFGRVAHSHKN